MTPPKTAADYAAIAVAPVLIFLMISSLANFLMLVFYHGGFPDRVSWTLLMFTLGAVAVARIAIEQDRTYALGYAGVLGIVTFVAMLRFVDSPIFSAAILIVIAYLADVIVRDCTLIDDAVDASGQGLIDSGRLFLKKQIQPDNSTATDVDGVAAESNAGRKTHQPGRTVMWLALAVLPLFGIGQFFLREDAATWARAQKLLAFYLFASLSLLVTTSFLGLRRYLRQRKVEMPNDVSIAWLAGGMVMIAVVLLIAYLAPLPGKAIASFEFPKLLDSPGNTKASRSGWGNEGADKSQPESPGTLDSDSDKEVQGTVSQKGAPPGEVSEGDREQGPAGGQDGGKQQAQSSSQSQQQGGEQSKQQSGGEQDKPQNGSQSQQSSSGEQRQRQDKANSQSDGQGEKQQGSKSQQQPDSSDESSSRQDPKSSQGQNDSQSSSQENGSKPQSEDSSNGQQPDKETDGAKADPEDSASQQADESKANPNQPTPPDDEQQSSQDQASEPPPEERGGSGLPPEGDSSASSSSSGIVETLADSVSMLGSLIKAVIFIALAGIVVAFVWMNRHLIGQWWDKLFGGGSREIEPADSFEDFVDSITRVPPRAFTSFVNPIGKEPDPRRVVVITFQAFEAWTREHGTPRGKDETPSEFAKRISQSSPQMSKPASQVIDAYNRIVYGRGSATENDLNAATRVWQLMKSA